MSIRTRQLLLLLLIAIIPVALSGWYALYQAARMASAIELETRERILSRDRHYMMEKVSDIGHSLAVISQATEGYLYQQRQAVEAALRREATAGEPVTSDRVAGLPGTVPDRRFQRDPTGTETPLGVNLAAPSFRYHGGDCTGCPEMARQLATASDDLRWIYSKTSDFSLWHYAGFANGLTMVYPAHAEYPAGYDPRARPWYRAAMAADGQVWLPLIIDASTGQPVLTAAEAVTDANGNRVGVTAIDLPLQYLLHFESSAAPWLDNARLALLRKNPAGGFDIVATREPLEEESDWRSHAQIAPLKGLGDAQQAALDALTRGESLMLDNLELAGMQYRAAVTSASSEGDSLLLLASPHSAIDRAVARTLAVIEAERSSMLNNYLWGTLALIGLVVLLAGYFAHRVTDSLIRMSRTAEDLASGRLESRTGIQADDEIGLLSSSIDTMADSIEKLQKEQEQAYREMIMSLHRALEKKDAYTAGHSGRVTRYAMQLGKRIGLDEETLEKLRFGSLTHDLGKIGIPDAVLNKPAPLDAEEFEIMKKHPGFSKTIMKPLVRFQEYAEIAGSHHEHWDGTGYPEGLAGEEIHLLARITAIADAWDAMTGDRIYRAGMPVAEALAILDAEKDNGQFDPRLVREFVQLIREEQGKG